MVELNVSLVLLTFNFLKLSVMYNPYHYTNIYYPIILLQNYLTKNELRKQTKTKAGDLSKNIYMTISLLSFQLYTANVPLM